VPRPDTMRRPFVATARGRQLGGSVRGRLVPRGTAAIACAMTDDVTTAIARINDALTRIERHAVKGGDARYQRLRDRTQAALGELDAVIARLGGQGAR
jgi:hypothetical protein